MTSNLLSSRVNLPSVTAEKATRSLYGGSACHSAPSTTGTRRAEVWESPEAKRVTSCPRRTSSSVSVLTTRSVPSYRAGGTLSKGGATCAIRMQTVQAGAIGFASRGDSAWTRAQDLCRHVTDRDATLIECVQLVAADLGVGLGCPLAREMHVCAAFTLKIGGEPCCG